MKKRNLVLFGTTAMLSLALAGTIGAVTASAATELNQGSTSGTVEISYTQADSWKVTIPDSMEIGTAAEVKASEVNIESGTKLTVAVSGSDYVEDGNKWQLKNEAGDKAIDYTLKAAATEGALGDAEALENNGTVLEVTAGTEGDTTASIKGEVAGNPSTGGNEYTDTLTFTVTVA